MEQQQGQQDEQQQQQQELPKQSSFSMEDVMESMARISLAGLGGSIVGLSLEKRFESMKVTTPSGMTAAARRKRSPMNNRMMVNLPITWGVSCMVFCSIVETSRLTSPSTIFLHAWQEWNGARTTEEEEKEVNAATNGNDTLQYSTPTTKTIPRHATMITIADYSIGGAFAGLAGSFGRRVHLRNSIFKLQGSQRFFGVLPGFLLGLGAGCLQAAIDYGMMLADEAAMAQQQEQQQLEQEEELGHTDQSQ
mmetsp:Transcript_16856/g.31205  ORF Transcript_16856/g.31205 Transcript_16856/m.31205 type:complete len:250 (+) Transcript_16856:41-790(+)